MQKQSYAFGESVSDGKPCPAVAVFGDDKGDVLEVAEHYDCIAQARTGISHGMLPEDIAEACWKEAVEELSTQDVPEACLEAGREVAEELFD